MRHPADQREGQRRGGARGAGEDFSGVDAWGGRDDSYRTVDPAVSDLLLHVPQVPVLHPDSECMHVPLDPLDERAALAGHCAACVEWVDLYVWVYVSDLE